MEDKENPTPSSKVVGSEDTVTLTRAEINGILRAAYPTATQDERATMMQAAETAARYRRLHRVCERINWADTGIPAMDNAQTQSAFSDLAEIMLTDAFVDAYEALEGK